MIRRKLTLGTAAGVLTFIAASSVAPPSVAADRAAARANARALPASVERLRLQAPRTMSEARAAIDPTLLRASGSQRVLVRLRSPSVSESGSDNPGDQIMRREQIRLEQSAFVNRVRRAAPDASVKADVQTVLNAVVLDVDASVLQKIAADPSVARVSRVVDYRLDLSETVPYITATKMQTVGKFKGRGVKVAVLDSGIDYTHKAFGGAGTLEAYEKAYGTSTDDLRTTRRDGLFPTSRVVEGYDFVGEEWPNSDDLAPDDDPIDCGAYDPVEDATCAGGHGTHVADIIGGATGVAPKVDLYAVKVCSARSTSCSGVALLQGMEYAADPNGDGSTSDRVDIINMSLGSPYGQPFDDDLAAAVEGATRVGILTVASAGNSGDKPYATGTPSAAPSALSVAQTAVPSAFLPQYQITQPANIVGLFTAVFQPWSVPLTEDVTAPLQYGDGAGGNLNGCDEFRAESLAGKIILVDRGGCNFSAKIKNVGDGGGRIGIIGLITGDAPFEGANGGEGPQTIPGYMISQIDSNRLKSGLPNTRLRFAPNLGVPLVMSMASTSSRGPSNFYNAIKPEIGAPGASVSALVGTGTRTEPFGGTSGAAPMVAGSAALILNAYPFLRPHEVKARLMNNAFRDIITDPLSGRLAEITRIGNGEVRVFDAWVDPAAAWDVRTKSGALSFGQVDVSRKLAIETRLVEVRNYSSKAIVYKVRSRFRFADDEALGAVKLITPPIVVVPPRGSRIVPVVMTILGEKLQGNAMNSGSLGASASALTYNEIDGYLELDAGNQSKIHLAWQVLPRKAAEVVGRKTLSFGPTGEADVTLVNTGVGTAQNDAYALLAESPNLPRGGPGQGMPTPDIRAVGINTYPVPPGYCSDSGNASFIWAFAVNTWERQTHLVPVSHQIWLDTNRDGTDDYLVLNRDGSLTNVTDGRQLTWVVNLTTGDAEAFFYAEHATNTGNTVLLICGEQIGMNADDILATQVDMDVVTQDFYFGGPGDFVEGLTVTPWGERYFAEVADIAGQAKGPMKVYDFGTFGDNTAELGILLFTNGDRGSLARGGATKATEAQLFRVVQ